MKRAHVNLLALSLVLGSLAMPLARGQTNPTAATATAVSSDKSEDSDDDDSRDKGDQFKTIMKFAGDRSEDHVVPIASFVFIAVLLLGRRFLRERTEQRRLDLLRAMVDKGQPVPEGVVAAVLKDGSSGLDANNPVRQVRNGFGFSVIGAGLLVYGLVVAGSHHGAIILGIVFVGIGIGNLASHRFRGP